MTRSTGIAVVIILVVLIAGAIGGITLFRRGTNQATDTQKPTGTTGQSQEAGVSTGGTGNTDQSASKPQPGNTDADGGESSADRTPEIVQVSYTDEGFAPSTSGPIYIGDTVQFVNKSSEKMWVASDDHPEHTDYPGFDQGRGVDTNGSYRFTFEKAGSWGYHNHLNTSHTGTIQVLTQ